MAKGYWIATLTIRDQAAYDEYRRRNAAPISLHGGKFLVRGGGYESVLGHAREHNVIIEFPTHDAALACYRSHAYQDAAQYLKRGCEVDFIIIAGYEGPQQP